MRFVGPRIYESTTPPTDPRFRDLTGNRYGRLQVQEFAGKAKRCYFWRCRCDCGNVVEVFYSSLVRGETQSCGCLHSEVSGGITKHGETLTPEYRAWSSMKSRCSNPNVEGYSHYGSRGIRVCDRWLNSFEAFLADMGPRPSSRHSIDRYPDNDGNYEPSNCRWATAKQQANNRRTPDIGRAA